jgi:TonB family protein
METPNQPQDSMLPQSHLSPPGKPSETLRGRRMKLGIALAVIMAVISCWLIFHNIKKPSEQKETYQSSEVDKEPECTNLAAVRSTIKYPPKALESGQEGSVYVRVLVGTDGKVIQVGSITGPEVFFDEVKDKAKDLEFTPGILNGKPVKVWVTVPFNFKLKN